jgi:hypothetical protein
MTSAFDIDLNLANKAFSQYKNKLALLKIEPFNTDTEAAIWILQREVFIASFIKTYRKMKLDKTQQEFSFVKDL